MTYPPQPPGWQPQQGPANGWGRPPGGPYSPGEQGPGGTQQFGQPGQPGQPGQFGQFGQPGLYGGQQPPPGWPSGQGGPPPPRKRTGLIIGLTLGAVVLIGGVVTLILLLNSGDEQSASGDPAPIPPGSVNIPGGSATAAPGSSAPSAPSAPSQQPSVTSGSSPGAGANGDPAPGGQPSNDQLAEVLISAINDHDGAAMVDMVCRSIAGMREPKFSDDTAAELIEARDEGESGSIKFTITEFGRNGELTWATQVEGGSWCIAGK